MLYKFFFPYLNIIFIVFCILYIDKKFNILSQTPSGAGNNPNGSLQKQYFSKGLLSVNKYLLFFLGHPAESYLALSMFPNTSPFIGRGKLSHFIYLILHIQR